MSLYIVGEPEPIVVDLAQGTPGAPSPTGGVMTIQGISGMYPVTISGPGGGPLDVTVENVVGPVFVAGFGTPGSPTGGVVSVQGVSGGTPFNVDVVGNVGVTGIVGVTGYVGVTGTVSVATGAVFQGQGTAGVQSGGVVTVQGDPNGTPIPVSGDFGITGSVGVTGTVGVTGVVGVTGTVSVATGAVFQGLGNAGSPTGGVLTVQGSPSGAPIPVFISNTPVGVTGVVGVTGTVNVSGLGTAGTPAGGVVSVQGVSGGVEIVVTGTVGITGAYDPANNVLEVIQKPIATGTYSPLYYAQFGVSTGTVKATTGNLYSFKAINRSQSLRYLMLFNNAASPANGDAPFDQFVLPPGGTKSPVMLIIGQDYLSTNGVNFTNGILYVFSTTNGTLTTAPDQMADFSAIYF